jgi:hypothetical protein
VLDIYFKDNETVAFSWEEAITIEETGLYYLWFVICDAELSAATVSGATIWKNPTGAPPARRPAPAAPRRPRPPCAGCRRPAAGRGGGARAPRRAPLPLLRCSRPRPAAAFLSLCVEAACIRMHLPALARHGLAGL